MAEFYCDHGAYGLTTNRLGLDTPTWGAPQEGDGSSPLPAPSASTAFVTFSAAPSSGTISVMGVTVSVTSVTGAASANAAADQLATNINATTTATTAFGASVQLRNLVYARGPSGGAPAGTCQVMTRIGSEKLNYTSNVACLIAHTFGSTTESAANRQFSGGQGGCWGWFINPSVLGAASSIAAVTYGAWLYAPLVASPSTPTLNDTIWCRTGGGASKLIEYSTGGAVNLTHTSGYSKNIVFDTSTKWASDAPDATLKFKFTCTGWNISNSIRLCAQNGGKSSYTALRRGGFEIEYVCDQNQGSLLFTVSHSSAGGYHLKNVTLRDSATAGASFSPTVQSAGSNAPHFSFAWDDVDFVVTTPRATLAGAFFTCGWYATPGDQRYTGCTFDFNISGVSDPGGLISTAAQYNDASLSLIGCAFKGFGSGYRPFTTVNSGWVTVGTKLSIRIDNCSGLAMPSTYLGLPTPSELYAQDVHSIIQSDVSSNGQGLRVEDCRGVCEWLPNDPTPFPVCASALPGSGTPWSVRLIWIPAVNHAPSRSFTSVPLRMFSQLGAGNRTLTLRLLADSQVTSGIRARFSYVDASGVARSEDSDALLADSTTWTNAELYPSHTARKFVVNTSFPVAANSEIVCTVSFVAPAQTALPTGVYVDPEFGVS